MIIINQILDETLRHAREINGLKTLFWQIFGRPEHLSGIHQVFNSLTDSPGKPALEKRDLNRATGLPAEHKQFADHFFFLNSTNENFLTLADFQAYLRRYLPSQAAAAPYANPPNPMMAQVSAILQKELAFFNAVQPKKEALRASFPNENRYFDFVLGLFHDLSTYSGRAKVQAVDFQKFNVDLRQKHGFPLFSMSEFSLLQNYFDLNCDSAISQEEFLYVLMDYPLLQRYLQIRLHEHIKRVGNEPFLPFNRNDVNVQYSLNNFVLGDVQPSGNQNLKSLIMRGSQNPRFETDAVVVGSNMVFRQQNYGQMLRGQNSPQVIIPIDPSQPEAEQVAAHSMYDGGPHDPSLSDSRRVVLKDIKMTQLTVDEMANRGDAIHNLDEVHSRDLGSIRKAPPPRQGLDESVEGNLSQLDQSVRKNIADFQY